MDGGGKGSGHPGVIILEKQPSESNRFASV